MSRPLVRIGLALAFLAFTAVPIAAQDALIGVKGGLNVSEVSVEDFEDATESTTGFLGGGFLRLGLGDVLALQPELLFTQKGTEDTGGSEVNLDYLELPLLLMARIPVAGSPIRPHLFAGPALAFELACGIEAAANGATVSADCDDEALTDELDTGSLDFGAVFGAGTDIDLGDRAALTVEGRYTLGLTDILDVEVEEALKNRVLSFMIGLGFRLP